VYLPAHFREDRPDILDAFVVAHPLGLLVTMQDGRPTIDPIPMRLELAADGSRHLLGHVARANAAATTVPSQSQVLVMFGGANQYISPSWYASKQIDGRVVPTWNYSIVEVRGRIDWFRDREPLLALVNRLTDTYESRRASPWKVGDAPEDYIDGMLKAIVGFDISVDSIVGKFKASQNRNDADRAGVAGGLAASGTDPGAATELLRHPQK